MKWNPEIVKPLLKRALFAAIMLPPLVALTNTSAPAPKKPAKDTIRIYRKTQPAVRAPAVAIELDSLLDKRCTGIQPPGL